MCVWVRYSLIKLVVFENCSLRLNGKLEVDFFAIVVAYRGRFVVLVFFVVLEDIGKGEVPT